MKAKSLVFLALAACSAPTTGPSSPVTPPAPPSPLGFVGAADTPADAAPDVVPLGGMILPSTDADVGGLSLVRLRNDGGLNCIAPPIAACHQVALDRGYYYTRDGVTMLDQQGSPIGAPLGEKCPPGDEYMVNCQPNFDAGNGVYAPWGMPPSSLRCVQALGNDFAGPTYCCPCP
jgi:hypothetical protein